MLHCTNRIRYLHRVNQHVSIIKIIKTIQDFFLPNYLLTSKVSKIRYSILVKKVASTRQAITKANYKTSLYPSHFNEQRSIVAKLDALSAETKKLEAIYQQKLADSGRTEKIRLTESLQR